MHNEEQVTTLDRELERYERAVEVIEEKQSDFTQQEVIEVLIARDALQHLMENDVQETRENMTRLCALDKRLRPFGPMIAASVNLEVLRGTLNRTTNYWWWTFEPPIPPWDRYDWVWNALTAGLLALAASFMVNIYSALSTGDATIVTALSTIIQAAGLALIGRGALTTDGQEKVKKILDSLSIPSRFHAESTFLLSVLLLITVAISNQLLDNHFMSRGESEYEKGALNDAELAYRQGLQIDPEKTIFHHNLGQVYEALGELESASEHYLIGSEQGDAKSLNSLGRAMINRTNPLTRKSDPALAEAYLLVGLQRVRISEESTPDQNYLYYQLNRNIGWALIQQDNHTEAMKYLEEAMTWRKRIRKNEEHSKEGGMDNCFLAYAYEKEGRTAEAKENWQTCINHAQPQYIHEYRWLITVGKHDIAKCVSTKKIVAVPREDDVLNFERECHDFFAKK